MSTRRRFVAASAAVPFLAAGSARAQDSTPTPPEGRVQSFRNVTYSEEGGVPLMLDLLIPPLRDPPRPAVMLIHGGAWTYGTNDKIGIGYYSFPLVQQGYAVANVSYRLVGDFSSPNVWPAQLDDVQAAVRWLRTNAAEYGIDPERIGVLGESAGGHLGAMLAVRDPRLDPESPPSTRVQACSRWARTSI